MPRELLLKLSCDYDAALQRVYYASSLGLFTLVPRASEAAKDVHTSYFNGSGRRVCFDKLLREVGPAGLVHLDNMWGAESLRRLLTTGQQFLRCRRGGVLSMARLFSEFRSN